ncbi:uncharacterized protein F4822DRAFT_443823 [Hypoxylon trugodes]|uniref:uncharacterized protein n=1 Tax=Hypoxylon trugodes TaxID=326681 RepID=UPI002199D7E8|nr:uncharacterized protein F4822DRAFT_443823 [Hypoxylon trugodes]KAI1389140.1 hypothetical protein F4822DRAFT_443823 [Hypoxylon trugodes]
MDDHSTESTTIYASSSQDSYSNEVWVLTKTPGLEKHPTNTVTPETQGPQLQNAENQLATGENANPTNENKSSTSEPTTDNQANSAHTAPMDQQPSGTSYQNIRRGDHSPSTDKGNLEESIDTPPAIEVNKYTKGEFEPIPGIDLGLENILNATSYEGNDLRSENDRLYYDTMMLRAHKTNVDQEPPSSEVKSKKPKQPNAALFPLRIGPLHHPELPGPEAYIPIGIPSENIRRPMLTVFALRDEVKGIFQRRKDWGPLESDEPGGGSMASVVKTLWENLDKYQENTMLRSAKSQAPQLPEPLLAISHPQPAAQQVHIIDPSPDQQIHRDLNTEANEVNLLRRGKRNRKQKSREGNQITPIPNHVNNTELPTNRLTSSTVQGDLKLVNNDKQLRAIAALVKGIERSRPSCDQTDDGTAEELDPTNNPEAPKSENAASSALVLSDFPTKATTLLKRTLRNKMIESGELAVDKAVNVTTREKTEVNGPESPPRVNETHDKISVPVTCIADEAESSAVGNEAKASVDATSNATPPINNASSYNIGSQKTQPADESSPSKTDSEIANRSINPEFKTDFNESIQKTEATGETTTLATSVGSERKPDPKAKAREEAERDAEIRKQKNRERNAKRREREKKKAAEEYETRKKAADAKQKLKETRKREQEKAEQNKAEQKRIDLEQREAERKKRAEEAQKEKEKLERKERVVAEKKRTLEDASRTNTLRVEASPNDGNQPPQAEKPITHFTKSHEAQKRNDGGKGLLSHTKVTFAGSQRSEESSSVQEVVKDPVTSESTAEEISILERNDKAEGQAAENVPRKQNQQEGHVVESQSSNPQEDENIERAPDAEVQRPEPLDSSHKHTENILGEPWSENYPPKQTGSQSVHLDGAKLWRSPEQTESTKLFKELQNPDKPILGEEDYEEPSSPSTEGVQGENITQEQPDTSSLATTQAVPQPGLSTPSSFQTQMDQFEPADSQLDCGSTTSPNDSPQTTETKHGESEGLADNVERQQPLRTQQPQQVRGRRFQRPSQSRFDTQQNRYPRGPTPGTRSAPPRFSPTARDRNQRRAGTSGYQAYYPTHHPIRTDLYATNLSQDRWSTSYTSPQPYPAAQAHWQHWGDAYSPTHGSVDQYFTAQHPNLNLAPTYLYPQSFTPAPTVWYPQPSGQNIPGQQGQDNWRHELESRIAALEAIIREQTESRGSGSEVSQNYDARLDQISGRLDDLRRDMTSLGNCMREIPDILSALVQLLQDRNRNTRSGRGN